MAFTDIYTACSDLALKFIQMLASTIVGFIDIAGLTHYRLNILEQAGDCADLTALLDCNINSMEPERQLVENVFALDECGRVATKIFVNSSDLAGDYGVCGERPITLIEMLARTIVGYDSHYYLNTITFSDYCDNIVPLLDCNTNDIEAERMLVENIFGYDDCDNVVIKIFHNLGIEEGGGTVTDYHSVCAEQPDSLIQLLARCIITLSGITKLNTIEVDYYCDSLVDFWTCANNHIDPERALAENIFAIDECGNLALKIFTNEGEARQ